MSIEEINEVLPSDWYLDKDQDGHIDLWYSEDIWIHDVGLNLKRIFSEILRIEKSWAEQDAVRQVRKGIKDALGL